MKTISKESLEEKYRSMRNRDLCQELGVSMPTLMAMLKKANINLKGSGNRRGTSLKYRLTE